MKNLFKILAIMFLTLFTLTSCSNNDEDLLQIEQQTVTKEEIQSYLTSKKLNFTFVKDKAKLDESNVLRFNTIKEFDTYLTESNYTASREDFTHVDNEGSGTGSGDCPQGNNNTFTSKFRTAGTFLNPVYKHVTFFMNNCTASGLTSYISGSTTGYTYSEQASNLTTTQLSDGKTKVQYSIIGTLEIGIIVGGFHLTSIHPSNSSGVTYWCCNS